MEMLIYQSPQVPKNYYIFHGVPVKRGGSKTSELLCNEFPCNVLNSTNM